MIDVLALKQDGESVLHQELMHPVSQRMPLLSQMHASSRSAEINVNNYFKIHLGVYSCSECFSPFELPECWAVLNGCCLKGKV